MIKKLESKMTDTTRKVIKGLIITCVGIIVFLGLVNFVFGELRFSSAKESRIRFCNYDAEEVNYFVSEYLSGLDVSDEATYILQGEYSGNSCLMYANDLITENTIISGRADSRFQKHWAAKVTGTTIEEVWTSKKELTESDLHPYTLEEQENSVHFVSLFSFIKWHRRSWVDDTDLVGYYKVH